MAGKPAAQPGGMAALPERVQRLLRESLFWLMLPVALYLLLVFLSYSAEDPGWSRLGEGSAVRNLGGWIGAWIADVGYTLLGVMVFLLPLALAIWAWRVLRGLGRGGPAFAAPLVNAVGVFLLALAGTGLGHLHGHGWSGLPAGGGGVLGQLSGDWLLRSVGALPSTLFLLALLLVGITLATGLSWFSLMERIGARTMDLAAWMVATLRRFETWLAGRKSRNVREVVRKAEKTRRREREPAREAPLIQPMVVEIERSERAAREVQIPLFEGFSPGGLPPLSLLDEPKQQARGYSPETLEALSRQVEMKLADFRIEVRVVGVYPGPVITRFELEPAPGIKGSQISTLDKDIARGLSVVSVRVVDVIPGKSVIGLEIPNQNRETVYLSEILRSREYDKANSPLSLALGKDIGGKPVVVDLARMPHLLVAGTTGSGKSVAVNAMILSLLYKATPEEVRLIMIDPKMLELSVYEGIPHLLAPVVTDMKEASCALRWSVAEMERRYKLMAAVGVRNLAGFNRKVREAADAGQPLVDPFFQAAGAAPGELPEPLEPLPYVVVIVDEFADMMMIVGKKVEELIARLAQKARAAGIHLILATQRPSVDVITGLIKANIPTRVAFQVSSKIDSRTILDQSGAETLLGSGDMLYLPPGTATPERVHGAFVDDHEVHAVVNHLRATGGRPDYVEGILDETQVLGDGQVVGPDGLPQAAQAGGEGDELYDQAVRIVCESRRASISGVQRRLKIGYNRAARLIEDMEAAGIVSPPGHNGNREVLAPPPPPD